MGIDHRLAPVLPSMHWKYPQTPRAKTLPVSGSPTTDDQPTRVSGTSLDQTLKAFSQSTSPLAASRQMTFSPSSLVPGLSRTSVYNLPFMTIGVLRPAPSAFFQSR